MNGCYAISSSRFFHRLNPAFANIYNLGAMKQENEQQRNRRRRRVRAFIMQAAALFSCMFSFGPPEDPILRSESGSSDNRDCVDDGNPGSFCKANDGTSNYDQAWEVEWKNTPQPLSTVFEDGVSFTTGKFFQDSSDGSTATHNVVEATSPEPRQRLRDKIGSLICSCWGKPDQEDETDLMDIPFFAGLQKGQDNLLPYGEWMYRENQRLRAMRLEFLRKLKESKTRELHGDVSRTNSRTEEHTPSAHEQRYAEPNVVASDGDAAAATRHLQMLFRRAEERWTNPVPSTVSSETDSATRSSEQNSTPIDDYHFDGSEKMTEQTG